MQQSKQHEQLINTSIAASENDDSEEIICYLRSHKQRTLHTLSSKAIQLNVPLISKLFACVR